MQIPAWSCAAFQRPLLDGAPLRIDVLCSREEEGVFIPEVLIERGTGKSAAGGRLAQREIPQLMQPDLLNAR